MFAFQDTNPCPYADEIAPDEDGIGYGLRMASANAISFHQLAQLLASPGHLYLPDTKAPELAFMFGATPKLLARAMVHRYFFNGMTIADYAGHTFYRPQHLRHIRPQLCPQCLASGHRALAAWSLTMMCCCTLHGTVLIDQCTCRRRVSWRRINLETCRCGRAFDEAGLISRGASAGALAISGQIEYLLGPAHFRLRRPDEAVLGLFDEVSLDTFLRVVWALGVVDDAQPTMHPRSANLVPETQNVAEVAERAYQRLCELVTSRRAPSPRIWRQSIDLLASEVTRAEDRRIVGSIIDRLDGPGPRRRSKQQVPDTVQLSLFGV
jgi:hypothetical protein